MAKISIRKQFLSLFMIIGLIPVIIISTLFYRQSSKIVLDKSFQQITSIQDIRSRQLQNDIEHRFSEFETIYSSQSVLDLNSELREFQELGILNSENQNYIHDKYDATFASYLEANSFHNVYLLAPDTGEVLYNYRDERGYIKDTGLYRLWSKSLLTKDVIMEDFSYFSPSQMYSAFVGKSIIGRDGSNIGVLVLQISSSFIDDVMDSRAGMGDTGESYLITYNVGSNKYEMRSNMKTMGDGEYRVGYVWRGDILQYWIDAINTGITGGADIYTDSAGKRVLVAYNKLDIGWLDWYLISKIDYNEVLSSIQRVVYITIGVSLLLLGVIAALSLYFSTKLTKPIIDGADFAHRISSGEYNTKLDINRKDELGTLAKALRDMGRSLQEQSWLRMGKEGLDDSLRGEHDVVEVGNKFITFVVKHLDAQIGALYLLNDDQKLQLTSSYAFSDRKGNYNLIEIGEGLVGQAALEREELVYTHVPTEAPEFNYGISSMIPTCYISTPLLFEGDVMGVFLIGITVPVTTLQRRFISSIKDSVAILLNSARSSSVIQSLLEEAQLQQEELRVSNEELEQQTEALKLSEKELQAGQEELRVTNEELEERTEALERQRTILNDKNRELEVLSGDLENKAGDLEKASQYKSEFLANMSHELRTPLNSILILSQLIANNKGGNLTEKQIKSANAINASGEDLLKLINEILDLSKVEAGKIEIEPEVMTFDSLVDDMDRIYAPTSEQKGINLIYNLAEDLPQSMITDPHRLKQVIKNLMTNAFKFTDKDGSVTLAISKEGSKIRFAVTDTGIGIPKEKQKAVFEAFKQADGSTSRKYGGTGLGLSISRELVKLLGGNIELESEEGVGSTFSIILPLKEGSTTPPKAEIRDIPNSDVVEVHVKDDREMVTQGAKTLLIIEDDVNFAAILKEQAHDRGFKVLIAEDGETGLHFADYYKPSGIILDIGLPGIDGWAVMERLKRDPELRHIPVHFMSGNEESLPAMQMGAVGYMMKPVSLNGLKDAFKTLENSIDSKLHNLLIIEDDKTQRESIEELISGRDVDITGVATGKEAFDTMKSKSFDCVILDLGLGDMSGYDLLDMIKSDEEISKTPIIIYTGRDLSSEEELRLNKYAESIIIKGVKSPERLLEESSLFLHRVDADIPEEQKKMLGKITRREEVLTGKTVLIVDDDMRNIFALNNILEEKDINVVIARDGLESIEKVEEHSEIDLILMDIMMPKMDGYEAIGKIRKLKDRAQLPIIALTANAMKGDRNKCIDAGANDYLAKPVDNSKLISMLRVWLY